ESLFSNAQQFLPLLQMGMLDVEAATKNLAIVKSAFYPRISFGTGISTGYSPNLLDASGNTVAFQDQLKNNVSKFISLSMYIPIFGNGRNWSNTKIAKINLQKSNVELKQKEQDRKSTRLNSSHVKIS